MSTKELFWNVNYGKETSNLILSLPVDILCTTLPPTQIMDLVLLLSRVLELDRKEIPPHSVPSARLLLLNLVPSTLLPPTQIFPWHTGMSLCGHHIDHDHKKNFFEFIEIYSNLLDTCRWSCSTNIDHQWTMPKLFRSNYNRIPKIFDIESHFFSRVLMKF